MPVFFYIDPAFADDPLMQDVDEITLSYTFFKARAALDKRYFGKRTVKATFYSEQYFQDGELNH